MEEKSMEYSVVVTIYNDQDGIIDYLNNIMKQTRLPKEIIIADGGSSDNTLHLIDQYKKICNIPIWVLFGKRMNISQGLNVAIKASNTDYIGITGVGNFYDEKFFELLLLQMLSVSADIVYGPILGQDHGRFSRLYNKVFLNYNKGLVLDIASNHGALIKKNVFVNLGFFYENFVYAGEDEEFYIKAKKCGVKTAYVSTAILYWDTPRSLKEYKKQVQNYTIAKMQIYNNYNLITSCRSLFYIIVFMVSVLLIIALQNTWLICLLLGMAFFISTKNIVKFGVKGYLIALANQFLPLYYIIKNYKYLGEEYKLKSKDKIKNS